MKKFFAVILVIFCASLSALADGDTFDDIDMTNYTHTTQNLKYFSQKEYDRAVEMYKNKFQKPKKVKAKDIKTPTTPYQNENYNPEYKVLEDVINHKGNIMIPAMCLAPDGQKIYPGYYSLEYYVDNNGREWLILSQGSKRFAKIMANKSTAFADEHTINYAYAKGKDNSIKLLYGNIDVAVEATLDVLD